MNNFKKTKIVATIGPASASEEVLRQLVQDGVNMFRLNFSHGTHEEHRANIHLIRKISQELNPCVAILQDLQGAKVRLGDIAPTTLVQGEEVLLYLEGTEKPSGAKVYPVQYDIFPALKVGNRVFINDGLVLLETQKTDATFATLLVKTGGPISARKGLNLPDTYIHNAAFTPKDAQDLKLGLEEKVDYIALSFIQTADDIRNVRKLFATHHPKIITKFETQQAVNDIEEIIKETDVIMVARGDLAVEVGQEEIPLLQRKIIRLCRKYATPVIVATQMLESMVTNAQPTRAEVNDVATAVLDKTDAVMLSAESAVGCNPPLVVQTMARIARRVEQEQDTLGDDQDHQTLFSLTNMQVTDSLAQAASIVAHQIDAKAILSITATGTTAIAISGYRPHVPTFVVCSDMLLARQLSLVYGIYPQYVENITDNEIIFDHMTQDLLQSQFLTSGDKIVLVEGSIPGKPGGTDTIKILTI